MLFRTALTLALMIAVPTFAAVPAPRLTTLAVPPADSVALAARAVGRVAAPAGGRGWHYQWPGTYFEARFSGTTVFVDLGTGRKHARVSVDGAEVADLITADRPTLRIDGLAQAEHQVRVDFVNENQAGVQSFGGFAVPAGERALAAPARPRAIEFIGDSYTVGYGAASTTPECDDEQVWRTTDTSLAYGPQVARHFNADYRLMAVSGRGMVRNYANSGGLTLPQSYERLLPAEPGVMPAQGDAGWSPQLVVIGLGTNDFSTPVGAGEPWRNAADLSAAFEARYVDFVQALARRYPSARFLLVATDAGDGAAEQAIRRVHSRLHDGGVAVAEVLRLGRLQLHACNWHPTAEDHRAIARQVIGAIDALAPW